MAFTDSVVVGVVLSMSFGLVIYALHRKRDVKAILKIRFATFSFEARGDTQNHSRARDEIEKLSSLQDELVSRKQYID